MGHRVDQGALAGTRHAGDGDEHTEWDVDREVAEVVRRRVLDQDRPGRPTNVRLDCLTLLEVTTRRCIGLPQLCNGACEIASGAGPGTDVDDEVGAAITSRSCSTTSTVLPLSRSRGGVGSCWQCRGREVLWSVRRTRR